MTKPVDEIVHNVLLELSAHLDNRNIAVDAIMRQCLTAAFKDVSPENKAYLYRCLFWEFHPDELAEHKPLLYDKLQALQAARVPQEVVKQFQPRLKKLIDTVAENPNYNAPAIDSYFLSLITPLLTAHHRYVSPVKRLAKLLFGFINFAFGIMALPFLMILLFAELGRKVLLSLDKTALDIVTDGYYSCTVNDYKQQKGLVRAQAEELYLEPWRKRWKLTSRELQKHSEGKKQKEINYTERDIELASNDDILAFIKLYFIRKLEKQQRITGLANTAEEREQAANDLIEQGIQRHIIIYGKVQLRLVALALAKTLRRPLPQNRIAAFFSILLIRPLQLTLAPLFIFATALLEGWRYLDTLAHFAVASVGLVVKTASLLVINVPLYLFDACRTLSNITSVLSTKEERVDDNVDILSDSSAIIENESVADLAFANNSKSRGFPISDDNRAPEESHKCSGTANSKSNCSFFSPRNSKTSTSSSSALSFTKRG